MRKMLTESMNLVQPCLTLNGDKYAKITGRCIYGWFRGPRCLYIGKANDGLNRITKHDVIGKRGELKASDTIRIWSFDDSEPSDALDYWEEKLIKLLRPYYNIAHNENGEYATYKRERIAKVSALRSFLYSKENMAEVLQSKMQKRFLLGDAQGGGRAKTFEDLSDGELVIAEMMVSDFKISLRKMSEEHERLFE